jgi:coenzyme PQQ precursor peptide PqqA
MNPKIALERQQHAVNGALMIAPSAAADEQRKAAMLKPDTSSCCVVVEAALPFSIQRHWRLRPKTREIVMAWTTPTLIEICIGLEINGYLPAEF